MEDRVSQFLSYLQVKNEFGQTIYGHLAQIIAKLLDDRPADAVAAMGQISREIKASAGVRELDAANGQRLTDEEYELIQLALDLFAGKTEEPVVDPRTAVQNVLQLNQKLNILGKGFDEQTALLLQKQINDFADKRKGYFTQIGFFGRFQTQAGNYYVLECLPAKPRKQMFRFTGKPMQSTIPDSFKQHRLPKQFVSEEKIHFMSTKKQKKLKAYVDSVLSKLDPENLQFDLSTIPPPPKFTQQTTYPRGDNVHPQGVNRFIYFVTKDINQVQAQWERLPDLEARQVRLSRLFQTKLTGDLTSRIWDRIPPFPGCEAHYLRCLISRIKHGAQLAPAACVKLEDAPEQEEEDLTEEQQKIEAAEKLANPKDQEDFTRDCVEAEAPKEKLMKKHFIQWPSINPEMEEIEFESLVKSDAWVHMCPVLTHRGVVLPFELPEEAEPEPEEEEADQEEPEEEAKEAEAEEKGEEGEEKEPVPPTVQERLTALYNECDQKRLLEENNGVMKEVAKTKVLCQKPRAHWELIRDPWEAARKENKGIYVNDRFFGIEGQPIDINAKQQELPEKEAQFWEKQAEKEEQLKALDEQAAEGDFYDEEKEILTGERPEPMAPASGDSEIIIHSVKIPEVAVQAEQVRIPAYRTIYDRLLSKNSPVIIESTRWSGMMNVVYNQSNAEAIAFASIYLGDGLNAQQNNAFDQRRFCLPPPMCMVTADLNEEPEPLAEIEREVRERIVDMERKDQAKAERKIREAEEKRRAEEEEKRLEGQPEGGEQQENVEGEGEGEEKKEDE
ncbi:Radial_spokehead-like protein [Hexamita inflata]|uniref:Radial_spokehead-like protein n=1 Tax=Hexamita inflata TaxID=28002 RepID=A0ABP1HPQ2_9EUKA